MTAARRNPRRGASAATAVLAVLLVGMLALAGCANVPLVAPPGPPAGAPAPGAPPAPGGVPPTPAAPAAPSSPPPPTPPSVSPPADPTISPVPTVPPVGRVVTLGGRLRSVAATPDGAAAVATAGPAQLVLVDPTDGDVSSRSTLTGGPGRLGSSSTSTGLVVPDATGNTVRTVPLSSGSASGSATAGTAGTPVTVDPGPRATAVTAAGDLVVASVGSPGPSGSGDGRSGSLGVIRDGELVRSVPGVGRPTALAQFGSTLAVLDTASNVVRLLDIQTYATVGSLPAGDGPTHLVVDRHGRLVVTDTRAGVLRRYDLTATPPRPLPETALPPGSSPYATAYDATLDRLWVTLTATNQVVALDLSGDAPRELLRLPTVAQPDLLAVTSGRVLVGGTRDGQLQIVSN